MVIKEYKRGERIREPRKIAEIFHSVLDGGCETDREKEHFWVIGCDIKNKIKYIELVSLGSVCASVVDPSMALKSAIIKSCSAIIFCHNHPSGETEPSAEDIRLTRRLFEAARLFSIQVLDHVIIGRDIEDPFYSFARTGLIKEGPLFGDNQK